MRIKNFKTKEAFRNEVYKILVIDMIKFIKEEEGELEINDGCQTYNNYKYKGVEYYPYNLDGNGIAYVTKKGCPTSIKNEEEEGNNCEAYGKCNQHTIWVPIEPIFKEEKEGQNERV